MSDFSFEFFNTSTLLDKLKEYIDLLGGRNEEDETRELFRELRKRGQIYDSVFTLTSQLLENVQVEVSAKGMPKLPKQRSKPMDDEEEKG